jgi:hypothetical protein
VRGFADFTSDFFGETPSQKKLCGARLTHHVTIAEDGFLWNGKTYPSLSTVARAITGTNWNGPRFFGMREAKSKVLGRSNGR